MHEAVVDLNQHRLGSGIQVHQQRLQRAAAGQRAGSQQSGGHNGRHSGPRDRMRPHRPGGAVGEAGKDAWRGACRIDQRIALRQIAHADQQAADVRIDHQLAVAQRPAQAGLPGAQVVTPKAPGGGGEHRLLGQRQEQVQADIAQIKTRWRRRPVIEEVDGHISLGVAGLRSTGDARIEHRPGHGIGLGQRRDDAPRGAGLPEAGPAGVEQPNG